eukprot:CAMPEP_0182435936 /NCGR_PEP_ID=MMETSP1167-20130531/78503_1 /TAXON_ID=2988 /ORGANISM="Mallomonas Sp, Strain CCMP3275" /LENGTH=574 /DNA_ID=CAMNT_0024627517 /DNA_START=105 /DNA_END=1826 /DNA_ORIENTATION=+
MAFAIPFISFCVYYSTHWSIRSESVNEFREIEKSITNLEQANQQLTKVLNGLETGKLSSNDPGVMKAIMGRATSLLERENELERETANTKSSNHIINPISSEEKDKGPGHSKMNVDTDMKPSEIVVRKNPSTEEKKANKEKREKRQESVLVVGGTDGSGTRRVVQVLTLLGVRMVSEDPQTYDIHADIAGGWPNIVTPVLQTTHKLLYSAASMPTDVANNTVRKLRQLVRKAREDSQKKQSFTLAVGGLLKRPPGATAAAVEFGFKAPVAMTLLPLWTETCPHLKFLHVLRDGRDIAFSANQGPVNKFYETMYGKEKPMRHPAVRGIRLWSDWNSDIFKYATQYMNDITQSTESSFGYMFLHTEDLVPYSSTLKRRFEVISGLAAWVGSNLNERALCCLALEKSQFMGSHDGSMHGKSGSDSLKGRYGKWKDQVRVNPDLGQQLVEAGRTGLTLFGYETTSESSDVSIDQDKSRSLFQCTEEITCPTPVSVSVSVDPSRGREIGSDNGRCKVYEQLDYRGGGVDIANFPGLTSDDCCRLCREKTHCKHFTLNKIAGICFLKTGKGKVVLDESAT